MNSDLSRRERNLRRRLAKLELHLAKTPGRSWLRQWYGPGYMIVDKYDNTIVHGCYNRAYDLTLEQVEGFVADRQESIGRAAAGQ